MRRTRLKLSEPALDKMLGEASWLLSHAEALADDGREEEATAELARAAGCVLLPVYLPRTSRGYAAHILPAIAYDRAALRSREARHNLSQEIMRVFEPAIRQHLDQWYHFVSIWP